MFDDVEYAVIDSLDARYAANAASMISLNNSKDVYLRNCQPPRGTELFLSITGPKVKNIVLFANDLSGVKKIIHKAADTPDSAVVMKANCLPQE